MKNVARAERAKTKKTVEKMVKSPAIRPAIADTLHGVLDNMRVAELALRGDGNLEQLEALSVSQLIYQERRRIQEVIDTLDDAIGDEMKTAAAFGREHLSGCTATPRGTKPVDIKAVLKLEDEVALYHHAVRKQLDTLLFLTDNACGLHEGMRDLSTPERRRELAQSARGIFVDALRGMQAASEEIESFRKDLQKNGGAK